MVNPLTNTRTLWFALALGVIVIAITCVQVSAGTLVQDDFTGTDGDPPDPKVWEVMKQDTNDAVEILDDHLLTYTYDMGASRVDLKDYFITNEITILVDYMVTNQGGRCFDLAVHTWLVDQRKAMVTFCYDPGYGWHVYYRSNGNVSLAVSHRTTLTNDVWYVFNLTIRKDGCYISAKLKSSGSEAWSWRTDKLDKLQSENYIRFGCFGSNPGHSPRALWDNFQLINLGPDLRQPPRWGDLPVLYAVEDIPYSFNFTGNASDPDTPMRRLSIESESPYFKGCANLTCTFVFPNGVTEVEVTLTLTDGLNRVEATVVFIIEPVNDAPVCKVPTEHAAVEDVLYSVVFTPYVSDVDNELADLYLEVTSPYATAKGLILTVLYLEGILEDYLTVRVCDGLAWTEVVLHFTITPVDDPPTMADLGEVTVVEDEEGAFDIGPFIDDIDTPHADLRVSTDDAENCTVEGHVLSLLYRTGGFTVNLTLSVTDGRSVTRGLLVVHVIEVNDAPVVAPVPLQFFSEDQAKTVDLAPYIYDEDTPLSELSIECDHHALVSTEGLELTLRFTDWEPNQTVEFRVFDRIAKTPGGFPVSVRDVNSPPVIVGIGEYDPPVVIFVEEGRTRFLKVRVVDEDSSTFGFSLTTDWSEMALHANGTLEVRPTVGSRGEHDGTVHVDDMAGGTDSLDFVVRVVPRNRPPTDPVILAPVEGSVFQEGEVVKFRLSVTDPDIPLGDVLSIIWTSNVSGHLRTCTQEDGMSFNISDLDAGVHAITVTVSDGEFEKSAGVTITIEASQSGNGNGDDGPDTPVDPYDLSLYRGSLIILVAVVVVLTVAYLHVWRRQREMP